MDFESKEWEIEGVNGRVLLDGNYNVLFANDNQIVFVDNEKGEILDVENCTLINVEETTEGNLSQKLLCYKNSQKLNGKRVKDVGYLDLHLDEFKLIKEKIEFHEILPTKNGFIIRRQNNLYGYDSELKNLLWELPSELLSKYANDLEDIISPKIKTILGIYKNLLWIHISGLQLIGIDIEAGKVKHYIKDVLLGGESFGNNFLDKENGLIKIFAKNEYKEFDLHHLTTTKECKINLEEEFMVRTSTFYNTDSNLYFSAYYGESFPNVFGVFNTEECKIVCLEHMNSNGTGNALFSSPLANDKFIVLRDNKNILHVFCKKS